MCPLNYFGSDTTSHLFLWRYKSLNFFKAKESQEGMETGNLHNSALCITHPHIVRLQLNTHNSQLVLDRPQSVIKEATERPPLEPTNIRGWTNRINNKKKHLQQQNPGGVKPARHDVPPSSFFSFFLGVLLGVGASVEMLMLSFFGSRWEGARRVVSDR